MNDREKRKKAQDVFNEGTFVFGEKTTFEKAFPDVEECVVEVEETGRGRFKSLNQDAKHHRNPGRYINCSNPECYNGGFDIGSAIHDMVRARETEREGSELCQGNEGSPKGRRIYKKCQNFFEYKITIKCRTAETF